MNIQYLDSYGGSGPPMDPEPARRAAHGAPREPPYAKSYHSGGMSDPRYRARPPPQQHPPPLSATDPIPFGYDESTSAGAGPDQWPLPALPLGQRSPRSNSPSVNNPRRSPRAPQNDYRDPASHQHRQRARKGPAAGYGPHPRGPPQHRTHHGPGQWVGDGYMPPQRPFSPNAAPRRPPPPHPSQSPLPDVYMPPQMMYHQQRSQRPPQGVPPSARRGPQGYYHSAGGAQPMYGEAGRMRAGSQPIPRSVNDEVFPPFTPPYAERVPSYYFEQRGNTPTPSAEPIDTQEYHDSPMEPQRSSSQGDKVSEQRDGPSPEPIGVIRQASLGKKTRPTLTTVKGGEKRRGSSGESSSTLSNRQKKQSGSKEQLTPFVEEAEKLPGAWISEGPTPVDESSQDRSLEASSAVAEDATAGAARMDSESKNSDDKTSHRRRSSDILGAEANVRNVSPIEPTSESSELASETDVVSPLALPESPAVLSTSEDIQNRPPLTPTDTTELKSPVEGWSNESGKRKLHDLTIDMAAVREAEARGSMTSLPDLIRRATRLASNLDRGKTASRMGLNFFDFNSSSEAVEKLRAAEKNRRSGSLSDMLTAFPAPGSREDLRGSRGNFSSMLRRSQIPSESDACDVNKKQSRKCCGLPLWLFLLLLLLLVLLVAAAIIIPVVLVVLPKQGNDTTTTAAPATSSNTALARCEKQLSCQNDGVNIIGSDSTCSCLCINGYTGGTCGTLSKTGCTTMSAGSTKNATVGENILPLISSSTSNFSIPLDGETLLGLFSKADLSCASENALVTFSDIPGQGPSNVDTVLLERMADLGKRQANSPSTPGAIVDFARVAVLYVFQQTTKLESAATAQKKLQLFFSSRRTPTGDPMNARNITLGSGFSCNLYEQRLVWTLSNGTTVAS